MGRIIYSNFCFRETGAENDTGVEGILRRLEEERNIIFGNGLSDKRNLAILLTDDAGENQRSQMSKVTGKLIWNKLYLT